MNHPENLSQRGHSIAGIDAVGIVDGLTWWIGGIVIYMKDLDRRTTEQTEPGEVRPPFVDVIDIGQQTRFGMPALNGDEHRFTQSRQ